MPAARYPPRNRSERRLVDRARTHPPQVGDPAVVDGVGGRRRLDVVPFVGTGNGPAPSPPRRGGCGACRAADSAPSPSWASAVAEVIDDDRRRHVVLDAQVEPGQPGRPAGPGEVATVLRAPAQRVLEEGVDERAPDLGVLVGLERSLDRLLAFAGTALARPPVRRSTPGADRRQRRHGSVRARPGRRLGTR